MQAPIFLDTTLRDGEQSPGLYFTNHEKLHIARELDRMGVGIIEAGIPSMGEEERANLAALQKLGLKAEILSWNRLLIADVEMSLKAKTKSLHLSIPTSDIMIEKKIGKKRDWIYSQMEKVISFALKEGATISFGAEDASRTDLFFLKKIFTLAQELGVTRVRFADTLGIMTPSNVAKSIKFLSKECKIPIDFHGHNDFGLATANALAAWENGAQVISCSLLGLGERAGNTSLEEFAGLLHYLKNKLKDFNFVALKKLCKKISLWTGTTIPEKKPIIGEKIYTHESGIHVDGILKAPVTYEFFPPEEVGGERKLVPGKHSGRKAIRHLAQNEGYEITDEQIDDFLKKMRKSMSTVRGLDPAMLFLNFLHKSGRSPYEQ